MDDRVYWIWLQQSLGYGSHKVRTIKLIYENIEDFYLAGEHEWRLCGCFKPKEIEAMKSNTIDDAARILDRCYRLGYKAVTLSSKDYPAMLWNIENPPCVLYVRGDISRLNEKICISIVGTRNSTRYGLEMAYEISTGLVKAGIVVVSGGAMGADSAAHRGALQAGGKTIAVLGCGIDYPYLMSNADLRNTISHNGAVISEFPPRYRAYASNFPIRNRIISGLSVGVVVIEAGEKSGSLITARLALDQNRDVFAVPVDMTTSVSKGTTALIRDGAKIVICAEDILGEYRYKYRNSDIGKSIEEENGTYKQENENTSIEDDLIYDEYDYKDIYDDDDDFIKTTDKKKTSYEDYDIEESLSRKEESDKILENLSADALSVYNTLKDGDLHIDDICIKTGFSSHKALSVLTELELEGLIKSYTGRVYGIVGYK